MMTGSTIAFGFLKEAVNWISSWNADSSQFA